MDLLWDMLRGYFYFTQQASLYILATCGCIMIPIIGLLTLLYLFLQS